jgi:hypothetical protein
MCAICHKLKRSIDIVLCSKCGGRVSSERIPKEIKRQEEDCGHKVIDGAFENLRCSE